MNIFEDIQLEDKEPDDKVSLYLFETSIDGKRYSGEIPAKSWDEAQSKIEHLTDGRIIGLASMVLLDAKLCAICSGDLTIDKENPKPLPDEWDDEIN